MLKKFIFALTAIMAMSLFAIAQDAKTATLTGFIVDKHCSAGDVATHGKDCVLVAACMKSGLGVYADGKFTAFDEKSSEQAKAALEKSKKDKGAKFKVTGTVTGDKMSVKEIVELP
jgi:type 1 fimbria pilin